MTDLIEQSKSLETIDTDQTAGTVVDWLVALKRLQKQIEERKKEKLAEFEEVIKQVKAIESAARKDSKKFKEAEGKLKQLLCQFEMEQRVLKAPELPDDPTEEQEDAYALALQDRHLETEAIQFRTNYQFEVVDWDEVRAKYLLLDEKECKKAAAAGVDIPGVRTTRTLSAAVYEAKGFEEAEDKA